MRLLNGCALEDVQPPKLIYHPWLVSKDGGLTTPYYCDDNGSWKCDADFNGRSMGKCNSNLADMHWEKPCSAPTVSPFGTIGGHPSIPRNVSGLTR